MDETDDTATIKEEASSGGGVAFIILFAAILLLLVFLFRSELGIDVPDVSISQPAGIPEGAMSVNEQEGVTTDAPVEAVEAPNAETVDAPEERDAGIEAAPAAKDSDAN